MPKLVHRYWPLIMFVLLLAAAWFAYRPGLSGGFLFDDLVNLDALGKTGSVDDWRTFWRYITSGTADPTGRPLALLSFLLDARDWPADPAPFLRTNLLLHLLNGGLLFALIRRLDRALRRDAAGSHFVALLASGMWLLHPLLVSTTLYIVQREAMLPATFVLLGLLSYAKGRERFAATDGASGLALMFGGILAGTALAILCKGNGALLPLLAWVLEATVYSGARPMASVSPVAQRHFRAAKLLLLVVPSLCLFAYVARLLASWDVMLANRPWTIGQRVLTEPRVLIDYLNLLVVPRSVSTGLYNDSYIASTGLLHPASTLTCLLALLALLSSALLFRRRWPRYGAAILFYFAGHLLESTTVPIELYFEHRNYLPAMLLFWPIASGLYGWKVSRTARIAVACALLLLLAATTYQRAVLWGKPDVMASLWARQNPGSSRAQATAAIADLQAGNAAMALAKLEPLWHERPYDLQIAFNAIDAACATRGLTASDKQVLARALARAPEGQVLVNQWISRAIDVAAAAQCRGLGLADTRAWVDAARVNPTTNAQVREQDIEPLLGQLALREHHPDEALAHFDRALAAFTTPDAAARQASMLAESGAYEQALAHLDTYERLKPQVHKPGAGMPWLHAKVLEWQGYWPFEMALLRKKLRAAIAERDANPAPRR
jgi:tetratricopeptide (TPR) repeat protein